jgi:putative inorganic carbon (HCO3(-)) transporter
MGIAYGTPGRGDPVPQVISATPGTPHRNRAASRSSNNERTQNALYSLSPRAIWGFLKKQPPSFWLVCIYLFFEYVRPQQVYPRIAFFPYARVTIILALVSFLLERRTLHFRLPEMLLTIFSLIILASSVTAFDSSVSYQKFPDYFSWVLIYLLIANVVDTEERFLVFMLSFLLYSFKMSQFGTRSWAADGFVFRDWGTTGAPGWFQNSGEFGIQMCIFLPLIVAFILALGQYWPRWWRWAAWAIAGTAVTGIVASSSRGDLLGLAAILLWALATSRKKVRALVLGIALAGVVYAIIPPKQIMRFQEAGTDATSVSRTTMWKDGLEMMRDFPILGVGYSNFIEYEDLNYGGHGQLPHNTFIQAGSELGYPGLIVFVAMIATTFVINRRTRRLTARLADRGRFMSYMARGLDGSLVGLIVSGLFISVLYYPFYWIAFAMAVALNNSVLNALSAASLPSRSNSTPRRVVRAHP